MDRRHRQGYDEMSGPSRLVAGCFLLAAVACAGDRPPQTAVAPPAPAPEAAASGGPASLTAEIPPEIAPNRPRPATRLLTYPWVGPEERGSASIRVVDDLVIEEREGERRFDFQDAVNLVTDGAGRMYVHDSGNYRVIAYEPDGTFARQFGSLDDAPFHLGWIAWVGDRLAMSTGTKVTVWNPDGSHAFDRSLLRFAFHQGVRGVADGSLVGPFRAQDQALDSWYSVEKRPLDGDDSLTYWAVRVPARGSSAPRAQPDFATTRTGEVYLTRGDEYAVQAFGADGRARWLLHVARPESVETPPAPALSVAAGGRPRGVGHPLRVDGFGNLYVFPYVAAPDARGRVPVDVYSAAGERLFVGWMGQRSWIEASGDFVYGIEGVQEAQRIVRYRLEAPFLQAAPRVSGARRETGRDAARPAACC